MSKPEYDRTFSYNDLQNILANILSMEIDEQFPMQNSYLNPKLSDSNIRSILKPPIPVVGRTVYDCRIGTNDLLVNMDEHGMVRDIDFVKCVKSIMHEKQHLIMHTTLYTNELHGRDLDMARMEMLYSVFGKYKMDTYWYQPCEIKAEQGAFVATVEAFDSWINDSLGTHIDAEYCILQKLEERSQKHNRVWIPGNPIHSMDDVLKSLKSLEDVYLTHERKFPLSEDDPIDRANLKRLELTGAWQDVLSETNRKGVQYDEKLFAVAMDLNPIWKDFYKGIRIEAKRIEKQYPSQLKHNPFLDSLSELSKRNQQDISQL